MPTFLDALKSAGYLTAAFVGDRDYSPKHGHTSRFDSVFDSVRDGELQDWKSYGVFGKTLPAAHEWFRGHHTNKFSKFRLDLRDEAIKGGESGKSGIIPKDPFQSQVLRRIFLPSGHDEAMPPPGKEPLTPQEMVDVVQWIQMGAPFSSAAPAPKAP